MADTFRMENEYGAFTVGSKGASLLALKMKGHDLLHDFKQNAGDWAAGAVMFFIIDRPMKLLSVVRHDCS